MSSVSLASIGQANNGLEKLRWEERGKQNENSDFKSSTLPLQTGSEAPKQRNHDGLVALTKNEVTGYSEITATGI